MEYTWYIPTIYLMGVPDAVPVCTQFVPVRTNSELVHTKYPVPVMQVTIPDDESNRPSGLSSHISQKKSISVYG